MKGIPLIHNPAARSLKSARLGRKLAGLVPAPSIMVTDGKGSARRLAAECARRGEPLVAAAGGDGTVNEVLAGLWDANTDGHAMPQLGILPVGTMNVLALELGLPARDLTACWEIVHHGQARGIDTWLGNGRPLLQLGGVGLDATVVAETSWELKRRIGPLSYLVNAARILARPAPRLRVTVDAEEVEGALVLFGNGRFYGGPIKAFPDAKLDDGLLDVLVLRQQSAAEMIGFIAALATGTVQRHKGVWTGRGRVITVDADEPVAVEFDGEFAGTTPLRVECAPVRLGVRTPA